jgi:NAD-dependent deacetylase
MMHRLDGPIVILTGAGISAESGIQTFRGAHGLWEEHRIEDVATPEGFARNPDLVQRFYNERRRQLLSGRVGPNQAHESLGLLERDYLGRVTVVTQNIDDLHEKGGSGNVIHMHGELLSGLCTACGARFRQETDLGTEDACETCGRVGSLRPDIVWFGEMPYRMDEIYGLLEECVLFIAVGTSGNVYPAAGFVDVARRSGARTIEVNLEPSMVENRFEDHRYGMAGTVLPELVGEILAERP